MVTTGNYFEHIVEMLNNFKTEIQTFSSLGLTNINKHSENFLKRILNVTYGYELENLNKGKSNYPGLDLGDKGEGIAFQITATKKSEKIDETLISCLKHKQYETFKQINVFILTNKQSSYTLKTVTEPHFTFNSETNIQDFTVLLKDIEHLSPTTMKALYEYINSELHPVLKSIKENKVESEKYLLDVNASMQDIKMSKYFFWRSEVLLKTDIISVPEMYNQLNTLLQKQGLKNQYLPILNDALRKSHSSKHMLYNHRIQNTSAQNYFYGNAMLLEPSSITIEKANYTDNDILSNLLSEMLMLLTCILFFSKQTMKKFEIQVLLNMETNGIVYFHPTNSLVLDQIRNNFILESPYKLNLTLTNVYTSTLADLLQQIMHGFLDISPSNIIYEPFININRGPTEFVIDNIKRDFGINDYSIS